MGITVAVTRVACNTSTGTQDITTSDMGGLTPKAALLIASLAVTDGTAADGAGMYIGVTDGTTHKSYAGEAQHGQAISNSLYDSYDTLLNIWDGTAAGTIDGTAIYSAFITNGITIDWTDAPSSAWLLTVVLFGGTDLSANVGSVNLVTQDVGVDVTTVGFEADAVFAITYNTSTASSTANFSIGLAHNDRAGGVTMRGVFLRDRDNQATTDLNGGIRSDGIIFQGGNGTALLVYHDISSFDSSGFTVTPRHESAGNPGNYDVGYLALRFGAGPAVSSKVYTLSTPTSTGSSTDTGAGFEPQAVIYLPTLHTAVDTNASDATVGSKGIAVITAGAQYSTAWSVEDNAADSNTQSLSDNQAINLPLHDGAAGMAAAYTAFTSTGVTLNWTDVEASARMYAAWAIGANPAAPGGFTPRLALMGVG